MFQNHKTRFKRAEGALRFFFRLRELLGSGRAGRLLPGELPSVACRSASNAIDDYECIGWCMRGLDEIDLWLLGEVYGPSCFGERRRKLSSVLESAQREFPRRNLRLRQLSTMHRRSLSVVEIRLRELYLIPQSPTHGGRAIRRRVQAGRRVAQLRGSQAGRR